MTATINASTTAGVVITPDNSGALALQTNSGTTAVTIDTSQNVGIGTSSPISIVQIGNGSAANKVLTINGGTGSGWGAGTVLQRNSVQKAIFSTDSLLGGNNDGASVWSSEAIRFYPSGTQAGMFDSSGNLLIGNTNQAFKLSVLESADNQAAAIRATNASFTKSVILLDAGPAAGTSFNHIQARSNYNSAASTVFQVYGNGNVQNTNNSYGALSDIKLKENITDATPKLADLMQVKVRNYNLKADQTHKQIGVIAQELEQVFPAMVEETPDKDEQGNDLGTTTKGVKYSVFVPMLIKSIQELKAINDQQAETINALTARVVALENK